MIMRILYFPGLVLLGIALGLGGCSDKDSDVVSAVKEENSQAAGIIQESGAACEVAPGLTARLTLYPENPTSTDEVRACLSNVPPGYTIVWKRNGQVIEGADGERLPPGQVQRDDTLSVEVSFQGRELAASTVVRNSPPEVLAVNFSDPYVHRGVDIVLEPTASDPDGDPVSFRYTWWINGEESSGQIEKTLPGDRLRKGDRIAVEVVAMDIFGEGTPFRGREFVIPDAPPRFVSQPPQNFKATTYTYQARAEDADGDPLTYALEQAPEGMVIDSATGEIRWNLAQRAAGDYRVRVKAVDPDGMEAIQEFSLTLGAGGEPS